MFKLTILFICIYGVAAIPTVLYPKPAAMQINVSKKFPQLPGIENLAEKSFPLAKLLSATNLPGTNNHAERIQVRPQYLPGTQNLAEKVIPPEGIKKMSQLYVEYA